MAEHRKFFGWRDGYDNSIKRSWLSVDSRLQSFGAVSEVVVSLKCVRDLTLSRCRTLPLLQVVSLDQMEEAHKKPVGLVYIGAQQEAMSQK